MSAAPPPIPSSGIYDFVGGVSFLLTPDGAITLCLPEPNYESTTIELGPDAVAALLAFSDRVDLGRVLSKLGVAPPVHT